MIPGATIDCVTLQIDNLYSNSAGCEAIIWCRLAFSSLVKKSANASYFDLKRWCVAVPLLGRCPVADTSMSAMYR